MCYHTYFLVTRHIARTWLDRILWRIFHHHLYRYMLDHHLFGPPYHRERLRIFTGLFRPRREPWVDECRKRMEDASDALCGLWSFYVKHPHMEFYLRLRRAIA